MLKPVTAVFADRESHAMQDTETGEVYGFTMTRTRDLAILLIQEGASSIDNYLAYDEYDKMLEVRE